MARYHHTIERNASLTFGHNRERIDFHLGQLIGEIDDELRDGAHRASHRADIGNWRTAKTLQQS